MSKVDRGSSKFFSADFDATGFGKTETVIKGLCNKNSSFYDFIIIGKFWWLWVTSISIFDSIAKPSSVFLKSMQKHQIYKTLTEYQI